MIHVVVGIVIDEKGAVLIAQRRPEQKHGGGLWEFPGGKIEPSEQPFDALKREFREEVGINILSADPWFQLQYDYGDRIVLLDNWLVKKFLGEPYGAEGQPIKWVMPKDFELYPFPAGNREILDRLRVDL